tara:strand:- start:22 stop:600 length:579 start_codon:yes stop_codon:yes gene_type:complete
MEEGPLRPPSDGAIPSLSHKRLIAYSVGPQNVDLSFKKRLAHENGWDLAMAERAFQEYKRFAYMCAHSDNPCTPSVEVDQVWHLHMTYTRDYWGRFCPEVLGYELHHGPTEGGKAEDEKYLEQYERTLLYYQEVFGRAPPEDLWPPPEVRFSSFPHLRWVDLSKNSITPRRSILVGIGAVAVVSFIMGWLLR